MILSTKLESNSSFSNGGRKFHVKYPLAGSTGTYVVNWFLDMKGKVLVPVIAIIILAVNHSVCGQSLHLT